jgi:predicted flap endonuclease-1-like 5' DNA nuclease
VIWHFFEIWGLMLAGFAVGCVLGVALYAQLARSRLAAAQGRFADRVGDVVDWAKERLGVGPDWRPSRREAIERFAASARAVAVESVRPPPPRRRIEPHLSGPARDPDAGEPDWDAAARYVEEPDDAGSGEVDGYPPEEAADEAGITPMRPIGLPGPRNSIPDDLQRIRGIGKRNEQLLNELGIYHYAQIAAWTPGEVRWVAAFLAFPERIERDDWVGQATVLASGGKTKYIKCAERRRARQQEDD